MNSERELGNILDVAKFESDDVVRLFLGSFLGQRPAFDCREEDLDFTGYFHI